MKKIILILLILVTVLVLYNPELIIINIMNSNNKFLSNIFPSLFPFFILSSLLINYGFVKITSKIFKPIMKLFKINPNCSFILIMSMISGFPSSAKFTKELYLNKSINELEASKILMFTHFSNPLFILGTISSILNKKSAYILLFIHYISNFITGFILKNIIKTPSNKNIEFKQETKPFIVSLTDSINSSFNTLFMIFGMIIIFSIISTVVINYLPINLQIKTLLISFIEMSNGIYNIDTLNISLKVKTTIIGMILSFGGICIHMQIKSIISDTSIKYQPYLVARLLHSAICGLLIYFLYDILILLPYSI